MLVALLWAPNYLCLRATREEAHRWTAEDLAATFGERADDTLVLVADCAEIISRGSLNLLEQLYLYSFKLEHVHSLKLFTVCFTTGLIACRAPLYGGSSPEIAPMEHFLVSDDFKRLQAVFGTRIILFCDRGFSRLSKDLLGRVHLLHPGLEAAGGSDSASHAVWKLVRPRTLESVARRSPS